MHRRRYKSALTGYIDGVLLGNNCSFTSTLSENESIVLALMDNNNLYCVERTTDTIQVQVRVCDTSLFVSIPNVFSPNGDGINDLFEVKYKNAEIKEFVIYNRWGVKIYEGKNFNSLKNMSLNFVSWDGRTTSGMACEDGTYFYIISFLSIEKEMNTRSGFLLLIK